MNKQDLRKLYLQKRLALTEADYLRLNHQLCELFFFSVGLSDIKILHTFLPIAKNKEPDTWLIVERITQEFPNIQLSVPRVHVESLDLENFFFEGRHQLRESKWGIPEPTQGDPTPSEQIDMVLVPLLVFDKHGHRVGYGKGHYDRFLHGCRQDCKKIGLSFFLPVDHIPLTAWHDEKLDAVITPSQYFLF